MSGPQRRLTRENGAVAVIIAVVLGVLVLVAALVIDLGLTMMDVRSNQRIADLASTAGAQSLDSSTGGSHADACEAAWDYFLENSPELTAGLASPCSTYTGFVCGTGTAPLTVTQPAEMYTFEVTMPVPDDHPLMAGQTGDESVDGADPCARIGVRVIRDRDFVFAGVAGFSSGAGTADAVARYRTEETAKEVASLVVLDPSGCETLVVSSNGGKLLVESLEDGSGDIANRGLITVDSTGTECGSGYVMDTNGSEARLCAGVDPDRFATIASGGFCESSPGTLLSPSVRTDVSPGRPYGRAADVKDLDARQIEPSPVPGNPITRAPIDHQYNCKGSYPLSTNSGDEWHPLYEDLPACDSARGPNMDTLGSALAEEPSAPSGWTEISGADCTVAPGDVVVIPPTGQPTANLFFNCSTLDVKGSLTLRPDRYTVVTGWIDATNSSSRLNVNPGTDRDVVLVVQDMSNQSNALAVGSSARANLHRVFGYFHRGALSANADAFRWTAPTGAPPTPEADWTYEYDTDCVESQTIGGVDVPSPECFRNLAMWTNNTGEHRMRGGGSLDIEGVFFSPYAGRDAGAFDLAGSADQRLTKAQFFTYRFQLSGSATLSMRPDPERNIPVEVTTRIGLIR